MRQGIHASYGTISALIGGPVGRDGVTPHDTVSKRITLATSQGDLSKKPPAHLRMIRKREQIRHGDEHAGRSPAFLVDQDLLMQLLSKCLPLVEAATATIALLDLYDSYAEVITAPVSELLTVECLGERGAYLLNCVHTAAIHLAAAPLKQVTSVSDWPSLGAYLNTSMARERNEVFRVLFLNAKNHVISDQVLATGTINSVNVSTRDIAQKSLQLGATAILLIHNHPSGDPFPSVEDMTMTRTIENALALLDIRLHDHVIVGKGQFFSVKTLEIVFSHNRETDRLALGVA